MDSLETSSTFVFTLLGEESLSKQITASRKRLISTAEEYVSPKPTSHNLLTTMSGSRFRRRATKIFFTFTDPPMTRRLWQINAKFMLQIKEMQISFTANWSSIIRVIHCADINSIIWIISCGFNNYEFGYYNVGANKSKCLIKVKWNYSTGLYWDWETIPILTSGAADEPYLTPDCDLDKHKNRWHHWLQANNS